MKRIIFIIILFKSTLAIAETQTCTYSTYVWNTDGQQSVDHQTITKLYSDLSNDEADPVSGCTVCEEDQIIISIDNIKPFRICKFIADKVTAAIEASIKDGQPIVEITGYRVGKTKGNIDNDGNRTQFSNHSYGTAIDINTSFNGLYDHCIEFNSSCRLIKGGEWFSDRPESIQESSPIVQQMKLIGFQWGGKIAGQQKDFMHFSMTGY